MAMHLDSLENAGVVKGYRNWADLILQAEKLPVQTSFVTGEKITAQNRFAEAAMMKHSDAVMACKLALRKANELYAALMHSLMSLRKSYGQDQSAGKESDDHMFNESDVNGSWVSQYQEITLFSESPNCVLGVRSQVSVEDIDAVTKMFIKSVERLVLSEYLPHQQTVICQDVARILHVLSDIKALLACVLVGRHELRTTGKESLNEVGDVIDPKARARLMINLASTNADSSGGELTMVGGAVVTTKSNLEFVASMTQILWPSSVPCPISPVTAAEVEAPAVVAPVADALVVTAPDQTKLRWSRNQKLFAGVIATILAVGGARKVMNRPTPAGVSHVVATRAPTAPIITTPLPVVSASPATLTVPMVTDVAAHVPAVSLREIQRTCATTNRDVSFPSCVKALLTDARISLPASLLRECGIPGATTGADLATYQRLLGRELYRGAPWHLDHVIAPADQRVRVSWPQGSGCTDMTVVHEVKTAQGWSMPAGHRLEHVNGSFGHLMPATR